MAKPPLTVIGHAGTGREPPIVLGERGEPYGILCVGNSSSPTRPVLSYCASRRGG